MKKLHIYIAMGVGLFVGCLSVIPVQAQSANDKVIFNAMNDELQRNKTELSLGNIGTPFFMSYTYARTKTFQVIGSLGSLVETVERPWTAVGTVEVLLGDYHRTSNVHYVGQFVRIDLPMDVDYDAIRRAYWLGSDEAYKYALQNYAWKKANQKANPQTPEEEGLDDLTKTQSIEKMIDRGVYNFDRGQWEKNIQELSAIFKDYKELFNSIVGIRGLEMDIYKKTTEGVTFKQPTDFVTIFANATTLAEDGTRIGDGYSLIVRSPQDLPSMEKLKSEIRAFAENLSKLRKAPQISEYYSGPILFEDEACMRAFSDDLLSQSGLFAFRKPENGQRIPTLEDRMGRRILDNRITIKNYSTLNKYNNTPLFGAYEIDAEGVIPPKEITLVENGLLKQMLNGRIPTFKTTLSTGSSRFLPTDQDIVYLTAPGTIHIQAKDGLKQEKMKKALIKAAKEDGLDYAYIIRRVQGAASLIYRVDVKDGSETLMRIGELTMGLSDLKRLLAISSEEKVSNFILNKSSLASVIYPSSILVADLEIKKMEAKKEKAPALQFPLQRNVK